MRKRYQKITAVLLTCFLSAGMVAALPSVASAAAQASPAAGASCGVTGDCTWTLADDGVLTISGNGETENYGGKAVDGSLMTTAPWGANVNRVLIENGVTRIGTHAFLGCTGLTDVTIPDSVTLIGSHTFSGCSSLKNVTLGNGVANIGNNAFSGCIDLTSITIPGSVTHIGDWAFSRCSSLTSIMIPDSVTYIGSCALFNCSGLTSITIPDSVTCIGRYAFAGTAWDFNQPDGVIYAGKVAYEYRGTMPGNTALVLQDGTKGIADGAFYNCTGLASAAIPDSVTYIGEDAFSGCPGLTSVTIPDGVSYIGKNAFSGCTGLTSVTIPDSVTYIGNHALGYCRDHLDNYQKITGLTIRGKQGSAAEQYANDNGFPFQTILSCPHCHSLLSVEQVITYAAVPATYTKEGTTGGTRCARCGEWLTEPQSVPKKPVDFVIGDVNNDGALTINDATALQKYLAEFIVLDLTDEKTLLQADFDSDGTVTIKDVTAVQRQLAELF